MAALAVHQAFLRLMNVDALGNAVDKSTATVAQVLKSTDMQPRVIPDNTLPNTANYPTIQQYLALEAAAGYVVRHIDQNMIITYASTTP